MTDQPPRTLAGIDVSVLDQEVLTIADLRVDAAQHPVTLAAQTVCELYSDAASRRIDQTVPYLEALAEDGSALTDGSSALVDAAAVLRCMSAHAGDQHVEETERWRRLADDLAQIAGAFQLAGDRLAATTLTP